MTTTQTTNSTIKYVTWQVPVEYTKSEMEKIQDDRVTHAIAQIKSGKTFTNTEMLVRIKNLSLRKKIYGNNLD
jgi:predicted molibdopterin-dependent oxidoreductase YjgC